MKRLREWFAFFQRKIKAFFMPKMHLTYSGYCLREYCRAIAAGEEPARIDAYEKVLEAITKETNRRLAVMLGDKVQVSREYVARVQYEMLSEFDLES